MKVRRVVTGQTPDGNAVVASDTEVEPILGDVPGTEFCKLWGADKVPMFPDDGSPQPAAAFVPPPGGFRFGLFTVPPTALAPSESRDAGATPRAANHPGMHVSDTIDLEYVMSGEVWLELGDGHEVHLRPGDAVVQNGARHAWRNKGTEPCRMLVCMLGARRKGV